MWSFIFITLALVMGLFISFGLGRRNEIMANWNKYRSDPVYAFTAFMYKPDTDTRSRLQFTSDNFNDVLSTMLTDLFKVFLEPVFKIFHLFMASLTQSLGSLMSMKTVMGSMWRDFVKILDVFMNRFAFTFNELRKTYAKLHSAMQRTFTITTASVFQGISAVNSIMSMIDLMVKICMIILVVLVVMVIFFWFVLWPSIPVILIVVGICAATGAAVGSMASTFCFAETAQIAKADGTRAPISQIKIGDELAGGSRVTAIMEFESAKDGFYNLFGVPVSGSHIVFDADGTPMLVKDHPAAVPMELAGGTRIFCLNTTTHKIPVVGSCDSVYTFSDWEELSNDEESQLKWNRFVYETLNPGHEWTAPLSDILQAEAVMDTDTLVATPDGECVAMSNIRPGDFVVDEHGQATRVTGIVKMESNNNAVWRMHNGIWQHIQCSATGYSGSLFTEAGTFRLANGEVIRDFTDVGADRIEESYSWVLDILTAPKG